MSVRPLAFTNGSILTGDRLADDLVVVVEDGRIRRIVHREEISPAEMDIQDLAGHLLLPGFIDTQVNGGGGVLFNDSPDVDGIEAIARAHRRFGTTGFLPTLISDELDVVNKALRATEESIANGVPGVLGVHIEGPFLNSDRRGVHDDKRLRRLTTDIVTAIEPVRNGKTILTLAPEAVDPQSIRDLTRKGFIVCAGHSNASHAQTVEAMDQGLSGFTHLFNAMSQLGVREPGVVGAALDDRESWCGIIADGHHVSPVSLRVAYRCKGPDRLMLVTDAMPPVGSDLTQFKLLDKIVVASNGVCRDQNGTLAGTTLDMAGAVRNMQKFCGVELSVAAKMASGTPAAFLGLENETGTIKAGTRADFVVADSDLRVLMTWIAGTLRYTATEATVAGI